MGIFDRVTDLLFTLGLYVMILVDFILDRKGQFQKDIPWLDATFLII